MQSDNATEREAHLHLAPRDPPAGLPAAQRPAGAPSRGVAEPLRPPRSTLRPVAEVDYRTSYGTYRIYLDPPSIPRQPPRDRHSAPSGTASLHRITISIPTLWVRRPRSAVLVLVGRGRASIAALAARAARCIACVATGTSSQGTVSSDIGSISDD